MGWGMGGTPNETIKLLQQMAEFPVMAMKTLAAGQLSPKDALKFVFEVPQIRIATVGMTNKEEVAEIAAIGHFLLKNESLEL
jgi:hypothetical protein